MAWVYDIYSLVWDISDFFYDAYIEVLGWVWPFYLLYYPLYLIHKAFKSLLTPIAHFADWTWEVWNKVQEIFSLAQITAYFQTWINYAINAWNWITNAFWNVFNIIGDWWSSTQFIVLGWIDIATQGFDALIVWWDEFWQITWPRWTATLEVLGSRIDDFFTNTLPNLLDYLKLENWWSGKLFAIDGLIGSKLAEWFPFYDDIAEFFSDPGEFLLSRLTNWFLGPEE